MTLWRVQRKTLEAQVFTFLKTTCLFSNSSKVQNYPIRYVGMEKKVFASCKRDRSFPKTFFIQQLFDNNARLWLYNHPINLEINSHLKYKFYPYMLSLTISVLMRGRTSHVPTQYAICQYVLVLCTSCVCGPTLACHSNLIRQHEKSNIYPMTNNIIK